jgi:hypothetical protein
MKARPPAHDFLEDYEFVEKLGHKTKPGYFCGNCTSKRIAAPLRDTRHGW